MESPFFLFAIWVFKKFIFTYFLTENSKNSENHFSEAHHHAPRFLNLKVDPRAVHGARGGEKIARGGERYRSEFFSGVSMTLDLSPKKSARLALISEKNSRKSNFFQ